MTGRRKGTPCGCDSDPCGCSPKNQCIKTINGQYPDANHEFGINAGEGVSIDPDGNGIRIGIRLASPMVFRGTVGTGGTIATLPTANADNLGWTYVAISSGTTPDTPPKSYDVGDMLISNSVEWSVVPSGDDPVDWSQIQNKPTTVAGYGITDAVDIGSPQTITGSKSLTSATILEKTGLVVAMDGTDSYNTAPASQVAERVRYRDVNDQEQASIDFDHNTDGSKRISLYLRGQSGNWQGIPFRVVKDASDNEFCLAPVRTYNPSNTNDIVTIGSLQASSDVVHRTGNETVAGIKTFSSDIKLVDANNMLSKYTDSAGSRMCMIAASTTGNIKVLLEVRANDDGTASLTIQKRRLSDNAYLNDTTIATL